jgi:hypothetical protein
LVAVVFVPRVSVLPGDGLRFARFAPDRALAGVVESYWTLEVLRPPAELTVLPYGLTDLTFDVGGEPAAYVPRVLADALATQPSIPDAVDAYEHEMRSRTRRAVEESEESAQMFHFRDPAAVALRSTALRGASVAQRVKLGSRPTP